MVRNGVVTKGAWQRVREEEGQKEEAGQGGSEGGGVSGGSGRRHTGRQGVEACLEGQGGGLPQQDAHLLGRGLLVVLPTQLQQLCLCGL